MQREIKFRGLNNETNTFVYGYYTKLIEGTRIIHAIIQEEEQNLVRYYIHDSKTIGQYTGLKDKNEREIYENDFLRGIFRRGVPGEKDLYIGKVNYFKCRFALYFTDGTQINLEHFPSRILVPGNPDIEIVGNTHQNPELLEGDGR